MRDEWEAYWQCYEKPGYVNYTPQLIETIKRHVDLRGYRALEIGSGTGGNSSLLAALGVVVVALDYSMPALRRTNATAAAAGLKLALAQADAYSLPFESGSFDLLFQQGFLEHFSEPATLLREQRRVLRDGGYILIDVPQRYNLYTIHKRLLIRAGRWPYGGWEREFSLGELSALLQAEGFQIIDAYGRGYFPRPFEMVRNLEKAEIRLLKRRVLPVRFWRYYDTLWRRFERTRLGCYALQCIGVLAKAPNIQ